MVKLDPTFGTSTTAARVLDMRPDEFAALVQAGHLPPPRKIGPVERFDLDELRRVIRGEAMGGGAMTW